MPGPKCTTSGKSFKHLVIYLDSVMIFLLASEIFRKIHAKQRLKLTCLDFQIYMESIGNSHRFLEVGQA